MSELVLVRHGQASIDGPIYDRLSELGWEQGRMLGQQWLARPQEIHAAYTGPAQRHRHTAEAVAQAWAQAARPWLAPTVLTELDEHDGIGLLQVAAERLHDDPELAGLRTRLAAAADPRARSAALQRLFEATMLRWYHGDIVDERVESWDRFRERIDAGIDHMLDQVGGSGQRIVAFSSVGPIAVALHRALQLEPSHSFRTAWRLRNASVTTFVFSGTTRRLTLDSFNVTDHLPPSTHLTHR